MMIPIYYYPSGLHTNRWVITPSILYEHKNILPGIIYWEKMVNKHFTAVIRTLPRDMCTVFVFIASD